MKHKLLVLLTSVATLGAQASEVSLSCGFTEPFITIDYNSKTKVISRITPDSFENGVARPEILSKKGSLVYVKAVLADKANGIYAGQYELRAAGKKVLSLVLNMQGSDGMSDFVYPYDARMPHITGVNGQLWGGCESTLLKKVCPEGGGC